MSETKCLICEKEKKDDEFTYIYFAPSKYKYSLICKECEELIVNDHIDIDKRQEYIHRIMGRISNSIRMVYGVFIIYLHEYLDELYLLNKMYNMFMIKEG
jgi:hypothetical protein